MNGLSELLQSWWPGPNTGDNRALSRLCPRESTQGHRCPLGLPWAHTSSGLRLVCGWCWAWQKESWRHGEQTVTHEGPVLREFSPKSWRLQSRGRGLSEGRETSTYAGIRPADVTMSKVLNTEEDGDRPGKYTPVCLLQVEVAGDKQACCDVSSAFWGYCGLP